MPGWKNNIHGITHVKYVKKLPFEQALNYREVASRQELYRELWRHAAGATIRVAVVREGQPLTIEVASADRAEFYR